MIRVVNKPERRNERSWTYRRAALRCDNAENSSIVARRGIKYTQDVFRIAYRISAGPIQRMVYTDYRRRTVF